MKAAHLTDEALGWLLRQSREMEEAPEAVIQRAIDLWQHAPRRAVAAQPSLLKRLTAALSFDSQGAGGLAFGMRSATGYAGGHINTPPRQLLFSTEGRDIDVRISPVITSTGEGWKISGQILGPDDAGQAQLSGPAGFSADAKWNELSEFSFDSVPQGQYTLTLRSAEWEMELPTIEIPATTN
jgi:hypothetical protein